MIYLEPKYNYYNNYRANTRRKFIYMDVFEYFWYLYLIMDDDN
jgi:hypothetical protein